MARSAVDTKKKASFKDRLYPPSGLRVLVTAGASGIGAAIASAFDETGAQIHICDIDEAALAKFQKSFPRSQASKADVADEKQVVSMFETQRKKFGGLDVLIADEGRVSAADAVGQAQEAVLSDFQVVENWRRIAARVGGFIRDQETGELLVGVRNRRVVQDAGGIRRVAERGRSRAGRRSRAAVIVEVAR